MAPWLIEDIDGKPSKVMYEEKLLLAWMANKRGEKYATSRIITDADAKKYETEIQQRSRKEQEERDNLNEAYGR